MFDDYRRCLRNFWRIFLHLDIIFFVIQNWNPIVIAQIFLPNLWSVNLKSDSISSLLLSPHESRALGPQEVNFRKFRKIYSFDKKKIVCRLRHVWRRILWRGGGVSITNTVEFMCVYTPVMLQCTMVSLNREGVTRLFRQALWHLFTYPKRSLLH